MFFLVIKFLEINVVCEIVFDWKLLICCIFVVFFKFNLVYILLIYKNKIVGEILLVFYFCDFMIYLNVLFDLSVLVFIV